MFKLFKVSFIGLLTILTIFTAPISAEQSKEDIQKIIADYIDENPEIVISAIQKWQEMQRMAKVMPVLNTYRDYLENEKNGPVMGNPKGDITIVEFYDYRCGYCKRHFPEVMKIIEGDSNIRWVAKQYPILDREGQQPLSRIASRAALAAQRQGKFKEFHVAMMTDLFQVSEDRIYQVAEGAGLDVAKLKVDMKSSVVDKKITNSLIVGQELGFNGTPSYIIGDQTIIGAQGADSIKSAIATARKKLAK